LHIHALINFRFSEMGIHMATVGSDIPLLPEFHTKSEKMSRMEATGNIVTDQIESGEHIPWNLAFHLDPHSHLRNCFSSAIMNVMAA